MSSLTELFPHPPTSAHRSIYMCLWRQVRVVNYAVKVTHHNFTGLGRGLFDPPILTGHFTQGLSFAPR